MDSVGARLKKIRLEKGLSLEEVQKKTKVHLNVLKAIEEDSFVNLSPIYIKGFLKIYCHFLGVDPKDYIAGYKESSAPINRPTSSTLKLSSFGSIFQKIKIIFTIILAIFLFIGLFKIGKLISYKRHLAAKKSPVPFAVTSTSKMKKDKARSVKITAKEKSPQSAGGEQPPLASGIKLGIRAKYDDCWIVLRVDGRLVFKNMLKKGRFEIWQAKEKIDLSLGNAGVVELEINGKRISSLGRRGQAIKNISISKEGMVVPR